MAGILREGCAVVPIGIGLGVTWRSDAGSGAAAFNPASLFGGGEQGVIYDPSDAATMFQERTGASATTPSGANGPIGTAKDLSPNNNYATNSQDALRPTLRNSGALWWMEFDGTGDFIRSTFACPQPITQILAWRPVAVGSAFRSVVSSPSTNGMFYANSATYNIYSGAVLAGMAISDGSDNVITIQYNGLSSRFARDNGSYSSGNAGSLAPDGFQLTESGGNAASMRVYFALSIGRLLSDPEIAQMRTYAGAKAGLAL